MRASLSWAVNGVASSSARRAPANCSLRQKPQVPPQLEVQISSRLIHVSSVHPSVTVSTYHVVNNRKAPPSSALDTTASKDVISKKVPRKMFGKLNLQRVTQIFTPPAQHQVQIPAKTLEEALSGCRVTTVSNTDLDQQAAQKSLEDYLASMSISVNDWLAIRNAYLSDSWPNARSYMVTFDDGAWPTFLLARALQKVETAAEASDALAVLTSKTARSTNPSGSHSISKYASRQLRKCFEILSGKIVSELNALHLLPRLSALFVRLMDSSPDTDQHLSRSIEDYIAKLTHHGDDRARAAIRSILDWCSAAAPKRDSTQLQRLVVLACLDAEKASKAGQVKPRSSERLLNSDFINELLQQNALQNPQDQMSALRTAIRVAGRERNYQLLRHYFDEFCSKLNPEHSIRSVDMLRYAEALARTDQGADEALHALSEAIRLSGTEPRVANEGEMSDEREVLSDVPRMVVKILGVAATNRKIPSKQVLSMLGIRISTEPDSDVEGDGLKIGSANTVHNNVQAYTVTMQGFTARGQPEVALAIWAVMLKRGVAPTTASVSVLLQALFAMNEVQAALRQLDSWCESGVPWRYDPEAATHRVITIDPDDVSPERLHNLHLSSPSIPPAEKHLVTSDVIMASVVFSGLHAHSAPGIDALWTAYCRTIARFPDAPVLSLLLKACCQSSSASRLSADAGREIFRGLLFKKHVELKDYRNPLYEKLNSHGAGSWLFSENFGESRLERWLSSMFGAAPLAVPDVGSAHRDLVFNTKLFDHYCRLLICLHHSTGFGTLSGSEAMKEELVNMLGWMKELHIRPSKTLIALTILELEECFAPPVAASQMELIDRWLEDWVGVDGLPTDQEMQRHWSWKMRRNGQGQGWFDRIVESE